MKSHMARVVPERVEQAHIVQLLRSLGGRVYVLGTKRRGTDYQGTCQTPGIGDLFCLLPAAQFGSGTACGLWIETKAASGRLRPEQIQFRDACKASNVPHVVGGLDSVIEWLIAGGWLNPKSVPHYRVK